MSQIVPKFRIRYGFAQSYAMNDKGLLCQNCDRNVRSLHQPFQYKDIQVCVDCFHDVEKGTNIKKEKVIY